MPPKRKEKEKRKIYKKGRKKGKGEGRKGRKRNKKRDFKMGKPHFGLSPTALCSLVVPNSPVTLLYPIIPRD